MNKIIKTISLKLDTQTSIKFLEDIEQAKDSGYNITTLKGIKEYFTTKEIICLNEKYAYNKEDAKKSFSLIVKTIEFLETENTMTKKTFKVLITESYGNQVLILWNDFEGCEINRYDGKMLASFHSTIMNLQSQGHDIVFETIENKTSATKKVYYEIYTTSFEYPKKMVCIGGVSDINDDISMKNWNDSKGTMTTTKDIITLTYHDGSKTEYRKCKKEC